MLDQSLLQSHFIGRDGFRWWIGQIPPVESMGNQLTGGGWGNRFKVRILGYHPYSESELPNKDLPWAQALIPTTAGSGAANVCTGVQLQPGDVVLGFFLDGDNAQIPVILSTFGRTTSTPSKTWRSPFEAFTGYSSLIPKNSALTPSPNSNAESNEPKETSNRTPQNISDKQAREVSSKIGEKIVSLNFAIGEKTPLANTVKNTQIDKITSTVNNLIRKIEKFQGNIERIRSEINNVVDKVVTLTNDLVGTLFDSMINKLTPLLKMGLDALYKFVYSTVFAATGNPVVSHLAGVAAQKAMTGPVKALEESFSCVIGNVMNTLKGFVSKILDSTLSNVKKFVSCAAEQFSGSLLNSIVGVIENLMLGPLKTVQKILKFVTGFDLGNILREGVGALSGAVVGFACNQSTKSFKGMVNEWTISGGSSGSVSSLVNSMADTYNSVKDTVNIIKSGADINSVKKCFTGELKRANPPKVKIFGADGKNAKASPIFGNVVQTNDGQTTASIIGIEITDPGSEYTFPPFVEIVDDNDQGYGAIARATINSEGQVESIYIVCEGENYTVGDIQDYSIIDVYIEDGGSGYRDAQIRDNFGNYYNFQIVNEKIYQVKPSNKKDAIVVIEGQIYRITPSNNNNIVSDQNYQINPSNNNIIIDGRNYQLTLSDNNLVIGNEQFEVNPSPSIVQINGINYQITPLSDDAIVGDEDLETGSDSNIIQIGGTNYQVTRYFGDDTPSNIIQINGLNYEIIPSTVPLSVIVDGRSIPINSIINGELSLPIDSIDGRLVPSINIVEGQFIPSVDIVNGQLIISTSIISIDGQNYEISPVDENVQIDNQPVQFNDNIVVDNQNYQATPSTNVITIDDQTYQITSLTATINGIPVNGQIYENISINTIVDSFPIITVNSDTGSGAILRPVLGVLKTTGEIRTSINCTI